MNCTGAGAVVVTCCGVALEVLVLLVGFMHLRIYAPKGMSEFYRFHEILLVAGAGCPFQLSLVPHSSQALRVHTSLHSKKTQLQFFHFETNPAQSGTAIRTHLGTCVLSLPL